MLIGWAARSRFGEGWGEERTEGDVKYPRFVNKECNYGNWTPGRFVAHTSYKQIPLLLSCSRIFPWVGSVCTALRMGWFVWSVFMVSVTVGEGWRVGWGKGKCMCRVCVQS